MARKPSEGRANNPVIILCGGPGTGKTTFALQFPKPYVIDLDQNLEGPFTWIRQNVPGQIDNILYDKVASKEHPDFPNDPSKDIEVPMAERMGRFTELLSNAYRSDAETIIIDSTTALQLLLQQQVNKKCNLKEDSKWEFEQWRLLLHAWTTLATQIRDRPKTTIICSHTDLEKEEFTGAIREVLLIQGAGRGVLPALVTDVLKFYIKKTLVPGKDPTYQRMCTCIQDTRSVNLKTSMQFPNEFEVTVSKVKELLTKAGLIRK